MYAKASRIRRETAALVRAPDRRPLSQLLPELLYTEQGGVMTPVDMELTPYMKEPADLLKSRRYRQVIFAGPARTGKSLSLVEGFLMDSAAMTRADTLLVHISQQRAAEFSKRNLKRAMNASAVVRDALSHNRHDNGIHLIKMRAGNFINVGWPSKNVFASATYQRVLITDLDRMPLDVDGEGSAIQLAGKRTQTHGTSGMVMAESSPGYSVIDPNYRPATPHESPPTFGILAAYNEGDRRLFHWQCPDCGEWFEPTFDLLQYDRDERDAQKASADVFLACPYCGGCFHEDQRHEGQAFKLWANSGGLWVPEGCRLDQNGTLHGEARDTDIASFWLKSLPAAFQSWRSLVQKYVSARNLYDDTGLIEDLKTVTNVDLGLPFAPPVISDRDANMLEARKESLGVRVVPEGIRFLIATIDVQGGTKTRRFEVQVEGFGVGLESVIIDRFKIEKSERKDPDSPEKFVRVKPGVYPEDWDMLIKKVMQKTYPLDDGSGRVMGIYRTACDSAGEDGVTDQAYGFWRRLKTLNLHRRFILIKGHSRPGAPLIEVRRPDNTGRKDRKVKVSGEVPVLFIQSDRAKDIVSACLDRDMPGARYCHYPDWLPRSFFDELMAEQRTPDGKWDKVSPSSRNEAFDLMSYARAVLYHLKAERILDWLAPPSYALPWDENAEVSADDGEQIIMPKRRRRRSS